METGELWTEEEEARLQSAVLEHGSSAWKSVAAAVPTRTDFECQQRWQKKLWPGLANAFWDQKEDELLLKMVKIFGTSFSTIAKAWPRQYRRSEEQIRQRWTGHLDPALGSWIRWGIILVD